VPTRPVRGASRLALFHEVTVHPGPRRLLVTRERTRGAEELTITAVTADAVTREVRVGIDVRGDQRVVPAAGVARIIELPAK
jgi:hypothetical protein